MFERHPDSDEKLIERVRSGDQRAFLELRRRHQDSATALAESIVGSRGPVRQVVAEAFARVTTSALHGGLPSAFRPHLLTVVTDVASLHLDALPSYPATPGRGGSTGPGPAAAMANGPTADSGGDRRAEAWTGLTQRDQAALWHAEVEGDSRRRVAAVLGVPSRQAPAVVAESRARLRHKLVELHLRDETDDRCRRVVAAMEAYLGGTADRPQEAEVADHLDECDRCHGLYLDLIDLRVGLRGALGAAVLGGGVAALWLSSGGATSPSAPLVTRLIRPRPSSAVSAGVAATAAAAMALAAVGAANDRAELPTEPTIARLAAAPSPPATLVISDDEGSTVTTSRVTITRPTTRADGKALDPPLSDSFGVAGVSGPVSSSTTAASGATSSSRQATSSSSASTSTSTSGPGSTSSSAPSSTSTSTTSSGGTTSTTGSVTTTTDGPPTTGSTTTSTTTASTTTTTPSTTASTTTTSSTTTTTTPPPGGDEPSLVVAFDTAPIFAGETVRLDLSITNPTDTTLADLAVALHAPPGISLLPADGDDAASIGAYRQLALALDDPLACRASGGKDSAERRGPSGAVVSCTITRLAGHHTVWRAFELRFIGPVDPAADALDIGVEAHHGGQPVALVGGSTIRLALTRDGPPHHNTYLRGDATVTGNALISCAPGPLGCRPDAPRPPTVIDADGNPSTTSSSAAPLDLPEGARVVWAALYWSGLLDQLAAAGAGGATPEPADGPASSTVQLAVPGDDRYVSVTADRVATAEGRYQASAEVTARVAAAGGGMYWLADAPAATDGPAGWALLVAYETAGRSNTRSRRLTVYEPLWTVGADTPLNLDIPLPRGASDNSNASSDTNTNTNGNANGKAARDVRVGVLGYDGIAGDGGDRIEVNGVPVEDGANPADDVANGTVHGQPRLSRPGFDLDLFGVSVEPPEPPEPPEGRWTIGVTARAGSNPWVVGLVIVIA